MATTTRVSSGRPSRSRLLSIAAAASAALHDRSFGVLGSHISISATPLSQSLGRKDGKSCRDPANLALPQASAPFHKALICNDFLNADRWRGACNLLSSSILEMGSPSAKRRVRSRRIVSSSSSKRQAWLRLLAGPRRRHAVRGHARDDDVPDSRAEKRAESRTNRTRPSAPAPSAARRRRRLRAARSRPRMPKPRPRPMPRPPPRAPKRRPAPKPRPCRNGQSPRSTPSQTVTTDEAAAFWRCAVEAVVPQPVVAPVIAPAVAIAAAPVATDAAANADISDRRPGRRNRFARNGRKPRRKRRRPKPSRPTELPAEVKPQIAKAAGEKPRRRQTGGRQSEGAADRRRNAAPKTTTCRRVGEKKAAPAADGPAKPDTPAAKPKAELETPRADNLAAQRDNAAIPTAEKPTSPRSPRSQAQAVHSTVRRSSPRTAAIRPRRPFRSPASRSKSPRKRAPARTVSKSVSIRRNSAASMFASTWTRTAMSPRG